MWDFPKRLLGVLDLAYSIDQHGKSRSHSTNLVYCKRHRLVCRSGVQCWNINTGINTPYMFAHSNLVSTGSTSAVFAWNAEIHSTPPGGAVQGFGCAYAVTTYQPVPPVTQQAVFCVLPPSTPIVIDTTGEGFHLTDAAHGVWFRKTPVGVPVLMAWTDPAYHNGWLALPRDGKVEALSDLFGNFTPQPPSPNPNGYLALGQYDLNHDA